jgi:uncharacterized protein YecT (DUF1311 family)
MRIIALVLAAFLILGFGLTGRAEAQACPFNSNDQCDQWQFEQAEADLATVVAAALRRIEGFAHPDTRQEAKDQLLEAQRLWMQTRDLDCRAESAFMWLRSARTRAGYTAACRRRLTSARAVELSKRYLLGN